MMTRKLSLLAIASVLTSTTIAGCAVDEPKEPFEPYVDEAIERLSLQESVKKVTQGGAPLPTHGNKFIAVVWSTLRNATDCVELANKSERIMAEALAPYPGKAVVGVEIMCNDTPYEPDDPATSIRTLAEKYGMQQATPTPKKS